MEKKYIERREYLNRLFALQDKPVIKIITGIRRCGKSTVLNMFADCLLQQGITDKQIIRLNFEDFACRHLLRPEALHQYVMENTSADKRYYLFFDEIQNVAEFPAVINSLHLRENFDIYITGSNAYMLSGELATLISGRYVEIKMLPLSFKEFAGMFAGEPLAAIYKKYLELGSFPGALMFKDNPEQLHDYLEGIYNTVVIKDIVARKNISDPLMLQSVVSFVLDNIGSELAVKKIADTMTSAGRKIDVRTVEKYLQALQEAFIIYSARRYNIRGRQHLRGNAKYYAADISLRSVLLGQRGFDVGHILENIVYLELLRRGYEVYVGKVETLEVDFVAVSQSETAYIQVAATVRDEQTLARELRSLQQIADHYPKLLLTLDEDPDADYNGIRRINALEWLMG